MTHIIEKDLIAESGFSRQQLRNFRLGQKQGDYEYPPVLKKGKHWQKIGQAVAYTEAGRREVMRRAAERNTKGE